jgi:hypothetical protein
MGIVQHLPIYVMVWMIVEMALVKRIATWYVRMQALNEIECNEFQ